jgi:hypothetical protein
MAFLSVIAVNNAIAAAEDGGMASGARLGGSGYVLHHGDGEKLGEYVISMYPQASELPSFSLTVSPGGKSLKLLIVKEFGDKIVFYTDTDGDGLVDEGMERDKAKKTLRKFKLRFSREGE